MKNKILLSIFILLLTSNVFFAGCVSEKNIFHLIRWEITDENGFPSVEINFNSSNRVTLSFYDPGNQLLYKSNFNRGPNTTYLPLSKFSRMVTTEGKFLLKVFDIFNNKISQEKFDIKKGKATILWYKTNWVKINNKFCLVELDVKLESNSQTPLYPNYAVIKIDGILKNVKLFPSYLILPNDVLDLNIPLYFDNISAGKHSLDIVIKDATDNEIANYSTSVTPYDSNIDTISYTWSYKGDGYSMEIPRLNFLYNYYHAKKRFKTNDYTSYVIDRTDDEFLELIDAKLGEIYSATDDVDQIDFIASFVQSLPYANDNVTTPSDEYPRYPVETLFEKEGDCEDTSILTAALLKELGYDVSLIKFSDHMSVGVHLNTVYGNKDFYIDSNGRKYLYLETNGENWPLGKAPTNYTNREDATLYLVLDKPLLTHEWQAKRIISKNNDIVNVKTIVENIGCEKADIVQVEGAFFTNEDIPLNLVKSEIFSLPSSVKALVYLHLDVPHGVSTVLKIRIRLDGEIVDESTSTEKFH
ncbi:MAG: transglutaminase domain-containing protein [Thermoplasmata archaeon]|nr:transglutaminase domain-containing protein [Thermoplasmata archaeon]